jgi:hypothetical protein
VKASEEIPKLMGGELDRTRLPTPRRKSNASAPPLIIGILHDELR